MAKRITADEFEAQYAERSGLSIAELRASGCVVTPCDCDYEGCEGWQQMRRDPRTEPSQPRGLIIRAAKTAGDFDTSMRQIKSTAGATPAEFARLSAQVEEMAG